MLFSGFIFRSPTCRRHPVAQLGDPLPISHHHPRNLSKRHRLGTALPQFTALLVIGLIVLTFA